MEKTKIGVIGLGGVAQLIHLPNLIKMNNVEITAVAELNKSRLQTVADKFSIKKRFCNYTELLNSGETEAVIILTPTSTHKEVAVNALKAKQHILVEKPLALNSAEAKEVLDTAKKYKKFVMVGMNLRYRPDAMILKSLIKSGEIGEPFYVKCGWIRRQSSKGKWFTNKEEAGGGVIMDLGILLLDLSLWLLDYPDVETVSSQSYYHNTKNVEDTFMGFIRCKNSSLINIESSWSMPVEKDQFYLNIVGTKGTASLNPFRIYKRLDEQFIDLTPAQTESSLNLFRKSYQNELKSFIGAIRGLNPVVSTGDESIARMKVLEAFNKSSLQKREINVKEL